ncbi:MAG: hypothetical protein EZS28_031100 [Streblomastix strix]|uniref:Uncharacterized protein n=1 Tax=Streblomastix strix TaxID=222440 RepID=A0A5J4USN5_9EUKA|nr:MAG: hypothetical protein EZS28_031100 [Streblomastix strix]
METTIETKINEAESEQVDQQIEKRTVARPKKYFNDDDRKEAIRTQQLATKRRYSQKKAQIYINIHALDENKVNLLRDTYKFCLQKVRKYHIFQTQARYLQEKCKQCCKAYQQIQIKFESIYATSFAGIKFMLNIFEQIAQSEAHVTDVIQIHDETLFGNSRYIKVGLVEQVQNFNQQINILSNIPQSYDQEQLDTFLILKTDKTELIETYTKTEDEALLLLNDNVADIVDSYSKTEDDALLLLKADKTDLIDSYSKYEDDDLLLLKANVVDIMDSYYKTEADALLLLKANKSDTYSKSEDDTFFLLKSNKTELNDSYSKTDNDIFLLFKANVADLTNYVDLTSAQTMTGQKQF